MEELHLDDTVPEKWIAKCTVEHPIAAEIVRITAARMPTTQPHQPPSPTPPDRSADPRATSAANDAILSFGGGYRALLAAQREPSHSAIRSGMLASALSNLDAAVSAGHPAAMHAVAHCLASGAGVARNEEAAFEWLLRAGACAFAPAMHDLGEVFERGYIGQETNLPIALKWYKAAAEQQYPPSQLNLGKLFLLAATLDPTNSSARDKAREWLSAASENKVQEAVQLLERL